ARWASSRDAVPPNAKRRSAVHARRTMLNACVLLHDRLSYDARAMTDEPPLLRSENSGLGSLSLPIAPANRPPSPCAHPSGAAMTAAGGSHSTIGRRLADFAAAVNHRPAVVCGRISCDNRILHQSPGSGK